MEDQLNTQIETQDKISTLVKHRQQQLSSLKSFYDPTSTQKYKNIITFGSNLSLFSTLYSSSKSKSEYKFNCENILSLTTSLGKILDLNNSAKTILIALKILEEHRDFLSSAKSFPKSDFITTFITKSNVIPYSQNHFIKNSIERSNNSEWKMKKFYKALYSADADFFSDFKEYLNFQRDSRKKSNTVFNVGEFQNAMGKKGEVKFYTRVGCAFELDWASIVNEGCDVVFMLYNKMMDKICYNQYLLQNIKRVDEYIGKFFIGPCVMELQKLGMFIVEEEVKGVCDGLERVYK